MKHLTRHTMIKDDNGKEMPALEIISLVIECLKDQLLETLKSKGIGVVNDNIHWVLTVQAIWTEPVKQFMREAAEKVTGICLFFIIFYQIVRGITIIHQVNLYMHIHSSYCNPLLNKGKRRPVDLK